MKGGENMGEEKNSLAEEERNFYEEWCYLSQGYSRSYYQKLSDEELIKMYQSLVKQDEKQMSN